MSTKAISSHAGAMEGAYRVKSLVVDDETNPVNGVISWDIGRSVWNFIIFVGAIILGPIYFSWSALGIFLTLSAVTLCAGHSVGFHRLLVHRSFECSKTLERLLLWMGTIVGIGGPVWTIRTHDLRDWAQRQPNCHDFLAHRQSLWLDGWYNLHCKLTLNSPPKFDPSAHINGDKFIIFLQHSWMLQQLPIAIVLYLVGGLHWVVWGVFVRVAACATMHWYISYVAHRTGPQSWTVDGAGVQAHDVPIMAIPTFGESWHNNHHAFPTSARHGHYPGQIDLGWEFLRFLKRLGLVWDVKLPSNLPPRGGLTATRSGAEEVLVK